MRGCDMDASKHLHALAECNEPRISHGIPGGVAPVPHTVVTIPQQSGGDHFVTRYAATS